MNIRKGLVIEFLLQIRGKAFEAVMKRHREEREVFAVKYLEENKHKAHVQALIELDRMVPIFRENLGAALLAFGSENYRFYRDNFPAQGFRALFFSYPVQGDVEAQQMFERQEIELKALKEEYAKIERGIANLAKGKQAAEYLSSLGFDISWIERNSKVTTAVESGSIDTNLLFPCKKAGLD